MKYSIHSLLSCFLLVAAIFASGCESTQAKRIDPNGTQTITTVGGLDIQDARDAAGELSESLLNAGILGRDGRPSIIGIDRYVNATSVHIDRDTVIKKIRVTLNKAGVAQTMVNIDSAGNLGGESNMATNAAQRQHNQNKVDAFLNDAPKAPETVLPDYSLTFKLMDNRVKAGNIRQTTYIFQMSLVDVKNGLAVWEDEKQITKQGKKSSVGW